MSRKGESQRDIVNKSGADGVNVFGRDKPAALMEQLMIQCVGHSMFWERNPSKLLMEKECSSVAILTISEKS